MPRSITTKRHKALTEELPSYADMHNFLTAIRSETAGSHQYMVDNLLTVLEQSAKLITTQDRPHEEAEQQLNEVLR